MKKRFELIDSTNQYTGFLKLDRHSIRHESYHGYWCQTIQRERLEQLCAVQVLMYDPQSDELVMVEQFRIGAMGQLDEPWILEPVGGFKDVGEAPEQVAHREALEEANCELLELMHIGDFFVSPGLSSERIHLYCARVDSSGAGGIHGLAHEGEEVKVVVMPAKQVIDELFERINSTSAIIAIQWFAANREQLRQRWCPS
ncbi:MAG: NUDIX domain-containing protein [Gammaproteobacteria bacterium]|nr:NUDIX domain-containing protein [Gammaproteobacteria bacterium]